MSTHDQVTLAALDNQAFALMGRLHVILRRESGRITDIEYMRADPGYCRHILEFAAQSPNPDLLLIRDRLKTIFFGEAGVFNRTVAKPLLTRQEPITKPVLVRPQSLPTSSTPLMHSSMAGPPPITTPLSHADVADRSYVGRLR